MGSSRNNLTVQGKTKRLIYVLLLTLGMMYLALFLLLSKAGVNHLTASSLDDGIKVTVTKADGTVQAYDGNVFPMPEKEDVVLADVPLPTVKRIPSAALCFSFYNSEVTVKDDTGTVLYANTVQPGRTIGHVIANVPVPESAWGRNITIQLVPQTNDIGSAISNVYAMRATQSLWYPLLVGGHVTYAFFIMMFFLSAVFLFVMAAMAIFGNRTLQGMLLALFCFFAAVWALGYTGGIYLCSSDPVVTSTAEYHALYLMLPLLAGYFSCEHLRRNVQYYFYGITAVSAGLAFAALYGEIRGTGYGYLFFLPALRVLLLALLGSVVLTALLRRQHRDPSRQVMKIGFVITLALSILEIIWILVDRSPLYQYRWLARFFEIYMTPVIGVVFISTLIISFLLRLARTIWMENEMSLLESIANRDPLTGIPNRYSIDQAAKQMAKKKDASYTVLFFDANDLKKANDVYGHEAGDHYLQLIGRAMRESFSDRNGFYGRYGGDEFLACVLHPKDAEQGLVIFRTILKDATAQGSFPFPISVAVGVEEHKTGDPRTIEDTIRAADDKMYENKKAMKGAENVR